MGGKIRLESKPSVGTTAAFYIPYQSRRPRSLRLSSAGSPTRPSAAVLGAAKSPVGLASTGSTISTSGIAYSTSPNIPDKDVDSTLERLPEPENRDSEENSDEHVGEPNLSPDERRETHILVVEDNAINQKIAVMNLRQLGFHVSAVWNGEEALRYLRSGERRPSVVLMDCQMPIMDGYEATRILRRDSALDLGVRDVPVVALTASAIQGDREKCEAAGMNDYLSKPIAKDRLEKMIVKWVLIGSQQSQD